MIPRAKWARPKCFTLIELIVVLVILGVLAALAIPTFNAIRNRGAETVALSDATTIARAATGIYALYDGQPGPIDISQSGTDYDCGANTTCDEDDAVKAAAIEAGFDSTDFQKGEGGSTLTGSSSPWTLVAGDETDNKSCAEITFADQAFTAAPADCP